MGVACSMHGGDEQCNTFVEYPEGKDCLEDLGIDGRIILKQSLQKYGGKVKT
jgi:hypothetical protein